MENGKWKLKPNTNRPPDFRFPTARMTKEQRASRKGLMAGGWWLVAGGWWLVIAEWRTETKRHWYPHRHRHPTKQQQQQWLQYNTRQDRTIDHIIANNMGNVPGKEFNGTGTTGGSGSGTGSGSSNGTGTNATTMTTAAFTREFLTNSNTNAHGHGYGNRFSKHSEDAHSMQRKRERDAEKLRLTKLEIMNMVVIMEDNVDGGYLAPYGNYKYELGYLTDRVRQLIVKRRLSPFFTPLQDFEESWTNEELIKYFRENAQLHENVKPGDLDDDWEDPTDHKIRISTNALRRKETKLQRRKIKEIAAELQNTENAKFIKHQKNPSQNLNLLSDDLIVRLYGDAEECPICFLFYPRMLNRSRCCAQPICTECFVQMRRLEPHFPHDEDGGAGDTNTGGTGEIDTETDPNKLISEPVKCPFCAVDEFGVTYVPPVDLCVGMEGKRRPGEYKLRVDERIEEEGEEGEDEAAESIEDDEAPTELELADPFCEKNTNKKTKKNNVKRVTKKAPSTAVAVVIAPVMRKRRESVPANDGSVITVDSIHPDWEAKLLSARTKMARRSAAATALHATSLMASDARGRRGGTAGAIASARSSAGGVRGLASEQQLEDLLVEQALRLSLLDEEERQLRERDRERSGGGRYN
jgi:hypothetical protein